MKKIITIPFKKLTPDAKTPYQGSDYAAGFDLVATSKTFDQYGNTVYGTGIAVQIPKGYTGFLFPRSSNAKKDLRLTNCVGVIDCDYRGEIMAKFRRDIRVPSFLTTINTWFKCKSMKTAHVNNLGIDYNVGERIAQLVILPTPKVEYIMTEELTTTERGAGGYGSTGK